MRLAGVDVRDVSAESLRDTLGMVTQDGHLFHDSIRENLLLARPEATEDDLWDAIARARLGESDPVAAGPVWTRWSASAATACRAVSASASRSPGCSSPSRASSSSTRRPPHLDSTNEAAVQAALTEALAGRTAVVIAHRLSTIRAADQILVIESGRIVEQGTHTALLAAGGRYEELYRTQFDQPGTGNAEVVTV